ncbi:uncharacterized protein M421DRAFT_2112 [Didymella exigua CBS 183.55]|uniref:Uncharacterized protein n=1 Tax=Didymella exigua CBS 183.55 TaxID=1150837 RepID=A0A6A5RYQ5_9PLEO|nr:uncharacterized protein M421DRAFT_2112 [Didymella exigua CBS 183.55]KAF1932490.1 hypothetical protein M421DRAFT_2112 [Didymella exigua CBS 183.55]
MAHAAEATQATNVMIYEFAPGGRNIVILGDSDQCRFICNGQECITLNGLSTLDKVSQQLRSETALLPLALNVLGASLSTMVEFLEGLDSEQIAKVRAVRIVISSHCGYEPFLMEYGTTRFEEPEAHVHSLEKAGRLLRGMTALKYVEVIWEKYFLHGVLHKFLHDTVRTEFQLKKDVELFMPILGQLWKA